LRFATGLAGLTGVVAFFFFSLKGPSLAIRFSAEDKIFEAGTSSAEASRLKFFTDMFREPRSKSPM
jgi:hypothetical protein